MNINLHKVKLNLVSILSFLSILSFSYRINGIYIFFFLVILVIILGLNKIKKNDIKIFIIINFLLFLNGIVLFYYDWFNFKDYLLSLLNLNILLLFSNCFYNNIKLNKEFVYKSAQNIIIILSISAIMQSLLYYAFKITPQITVNHLTLFGGYEIRYGLFRPFTIFSESSYFSIICCGITLFLATQKNANYKLILLNVFSQFLTFSITGILSILILIIYRFYTLKQIKKIKYIISAVCFTIPLILIINQVDFVFLNSLHESIIKRIYNIFDTGSIDTSSYYRIYFGLIIIKYSLYKSPIFGVGLGQTTNFAHQYNYNLDGRTSLFLNNTFYEIIVSFGIFGSVIFLIIFLIFFNKHRKYISLYLYLFLVFIVTGGLITIFIWGVGTLIYAGEKIKNEKEFKFVT